jgi:hypothetical protein
VDILGSRRSQHIPEGFGKIDPFSKKLPSTIVCDPIGLHAVNRKRIASSPIDAGRQDPATPNRSIK